MDEGSHCNITRVAPCSCIRRFDGVVGIPGGGLTFGVPTVAAVLEILGDVSREDGWLPGLLFREEALGWEVEYLVLTDETSDCCGGIDVSVVGVADDAEIGDIFEALLVVVVVSFLASSKSRLTRTGSSPV